MNNKLLSIRYKQERRFVLMGMLAISLTITFISATTDWVRRLLIIFQEV